MFRSLAAVPLLSLFSLVAAQNSVQAPNRFFAIVGARIEVGDGSVLEKGTIVLRNGLIEALGADVLAPKGAEIVDGKGLTVYPGFIDSYASRGIKLPDAKLDAGDALPTSEYASAEMGYGNRKLIRPEVRGCDCLDLSPDILKSYRKSGFTSACFVPSAGNIGGVGSVVNLSGRALRESVLSATTGLAIDYRAGGWSEGTYPSDLLGSLAEIKQAFYDADWLAAQKSAAAAGGLRPQFDAGLEALQSARTLPSFLTANQLSEVYRGRKLAQRFQLKSILVGLKEASRVAEMLGSEHIPAITTLNFGTEPKEPSKDSPPENPELTASRKAQYAQIVAGPANLAKAKVQFAIGSRDTKDLEELLGNLRKAAKAGLSHEAALKALTLDAANLLGVDRFVGSLKVGKVANLAVMTGDFLKEDTKTKLVFVDGLKFDPAVEPTGPGFRMRREVE